MDLVPPASLKSMHAYLKLAADTDPRDPVISYWIRYYVVNKSMKIDRSSPEAIKFLSTMMDILESGKASLKDNEAVTTDLVGQAHVENYGTRIFEAADREDRAANASLKTVKAFLAANQVFETLSVFPGGLTEEVAEKQKYAKYRASVIMKAVKSGEPIPLPENLAGNLEKSIGETDPFENLNRAEPSHEILPPVPCDDDHGAASASKPFIPSPTRTPAAAASRPAADSDDDHSLTATNGTPLSPAAVEKAHKYCTWAASALLYNDVPTAVDNMEKSLQILKTGQFSG